MPVNIYKKANITNLKFGDAISNPTQVLFI